MLRTRHIVEVHDETAGSGRRWFGKIISKSFDEVDDAREFAGRLVENDISIDRIHVRIVTTGCSHHKVVCENGSYELRE